MKRIINVVVTPEVRLKNPGFIERVKKALYGDLNETFEENIPLIIYIPSRNRWAFCDTAHITTRKEERPFGGCERCEAFMISVRCTYVDYCIAIREGHMGDWEQVSGFSFPILKDEDYIVYAGREALKRRWESSFMAEDYKPEQLRY